MKTVFMFSGQGSQYYQMAKPLFEGHRAFRKHMEALDEVVADVIGRSVIRELYRSDRTISEPMDDISLSHPAIVMVEYALARTLIDEGIAPDLLLCASLGTFTGAAVAGCMRVEDVLVTAMTQASLIEQHCEPGAMIAVFSDPRLQRSDSLLRECSELAGINSSEHFVLSSTESAATRIQARLNELDVAHHRLPVRFGFHSRWIETVGPPFREYLSTLDYADCELPIACCRYAERLLRLEDEYLWQVTRGPIKLQETLQLLEAQPAQYIDVGPGGTLAACGKRITGDTSTSRFRSIVTPFARDLQNFAAVKESASRS